MNKEQYFKITENALKYNEQAWPDSDDILAYGVPDDANGFTIMSMYEAMAYLSTNDPMSMIALRIPAKDFQFLDDPEHCQEFGFEIKDEYFVDYKGKNI